MTQFVLLCLVAALVFVKAVPTAFRHQQSKCDYYGWAKLTTDKCNVRYFMKNFEKTGFAHSQGKIFQWNIKQMTCHYERFVPPKSASDFLSIYPKALRGDIVSLAACVHACIECWPPPNMINVVTKKWQNIGEYYCKCMEKQYGKSWEEKNKIHQEDLKIDEERRTQAAHKDAKARFDRIVAAR